MPNLMSTSSITLSDETCLQDLKDGNNMPSEQNGNVPNEQPVFAASQSGREKMIGQLKKYSLWIFLSLFHMYLCVVVYYATKGGKPFTICKGYGLLMTITGCVYLVNIYKKLLVPHVYKRFLKKFVHKIRNLCHPVFSNRIVKILLKCGLILGALMYLLVDCNYDIGRFQSLTGVVLFLAISAAMSSSRAKIDWDLVYRGITLQVLFAYLVIKTNVGQQFFHCMADKFETLLSFSNQGADFVFGRLSSDGFILAFKILPTIIFFGLIIEILYYLGVIQIVIIKFGWILKKCMRTTACESISAAANVFLGQTEAPLIIAPYMGLLTRSELFTVMTSGFATIAGSVMAAYISFKVSASHLLAASVMSAPAALATAKLLEPELDESRTTFDSITLNRSPYCNLIDAASHGAISAIKICTYIAASLIAFIAFLALCDSFLSWLGDLVDFEANFGSPMTFKYLMSKLFIPMAWMLGVPWADCEHVGELIALKIVANEFVAYLQLKKMIEQSLISQRSITIATYALCGFANFSSIGIQIGGLTALAPNRSADVSRMSLRAMLGGNIACFLTACIAALFTFESVATVSANQTLVATTLAHMNTTTVMTTVLADTTAV